VRPKRKNIAQADDGDRIGLGREGALLYRLVTFAKDDLVDFIQREASDLDRGVGQDQLLELYSEFVEVPLARFTEPVDGETQDALVLLVQILNPNAWRAAEAELPRRLNADGPVEDEVVFADQDRRAEAEHTDRIGDLTHMRGVELADLARRDSQIFERNERQVERRQQVVARRARRR
jgi:hypothetical protein